MLNRLTVCILTYGDNMPLIRRCLSSVLLNYTSPLVHSIRVGLNAVTDEVRSYVKLQLTGLPCETLIFECDTNAMKYPMMRRMLYSVPVATEYVQWFDDDSCISYRPYAVSGDASWFSLAHLSMKNCDMIGDIWKMRFQGNQFAAIQCQPWNRNIPFPSDWRGKFIRFATGGWWSIRTEILTKWNYPFPELRNNGGDTMLGALIHQQEYRLGLFKTHLWINADEKGNNSKAAPRGESLLQRKQPLWYDYDPLRPVSLSHHDFECRVYTPDGKDVPQQSDTRLVA